MEKIIRWIFGLFLLVMLFYVLFLVVNQKIIDERYKRTHFRCTYIEGMCTKKPSYKNCKVYGSIPLHLCEEKLNHSKEQ